MLADYELDTESFDSIMEEARNMVISMYPKWTDFNYHDPGITMLELFSWMKEGQQFFLDQIGEEHREKYLKLLGMKRHHAKPAEVLIQVRASDEAVLIQGTRILASHVVFETNRQQCVIANEITRCFHGQNGIEHTCTGEHIESKKNLRLYIFGEQPKEGDCWYIGFGKTLPAKKMLGFQITLSKNAPEGIQRNPIKQPLYAPLLDLCFEYYSVGEWKEIEEVEDQTFGMLQSGMLYIKLEKEPEEKVIFGEKAFYLRIRVLKSDIDLAPILEQICFNVFRAKQIETLVESEEQTIKKSDGKAEICLSTYLGITGHTSLYLKKGELYYPVAIFEKYVDTSLLSAKLKFDIPESMAGEVEPQVLAVSYSSNPRQKKCIGIGTGLPYQQYELQSDKIYEKKVELLVHEIGEGNCFSRWQRVDDFGNSNPEDRHFRVDTKNGLVCFGDCEHGMAPEGEIILVSFAETFGEEGNVKRGTLDQELDEIYEDSQIVVHNEQDAFGGRNEETLDECFHRAKRWLKQPDTAVTWQDYERRVMETPGLLLVSCKAIAENEMSQIQEKTKENTLTLVVRSVRKAEGRECLSESYRKNILAYLEPYRLLGTRLNILAPHFVHLELTLDVVIVPHFLNPRKILRERIERYFHELSRQFGATIIYSDLYGAIDMMECVSSINDIMMDIRDGKVIRSKEGNVILPANGIIELTSLQFHLSMADDIRSI